MNPPDSRILFHEVLKFGEDFLFPSINLIHPAGLEPATL
jgi:hypothetical protein